MEGCNEPTAAPLGYCVQHVNVAFPCRIDDCANRVAAFNRSRCCFEHRAEGKKL
jgi:hypothetical protein